MSESIRPKDRCGFEMLTYWYEKHGDIDGHVGFCEESYKEYYPELMQARINLKLAERAFKAEVQRVEDDNEDH